MNQKNIFSVIAVVLVLQGIMFYVMGDKMVTDTFPTVDATGHTALVLLMQVMSALSVLCGVVAYANRTSTNVVWAYTIGSGVLLCVTLKHLFMDHVNVPMFAVIIQVLILLACAYLWSQEKKA